MDLRGEETRGEEGKEEVRTFILPFQSWTHLQIYPLLELDEYLHILESDSLNFTLIISHPRDPMKT